MLQNASSVGEPAGKHDEVAVLRRAMRDLVALSTLPAVWTGYDPIRIAENVADVLTSMLDLDLLYLRVQSSADGDAVEVARSSRRPEAALRAKAIGSSLAPYLETGVADVVAVVVLVGAGAATGLCMSLNPAKIPPPTRSATPEATAINAVDLMGSSLTWGPHRWAPDPLP